MGWGATAEDGTDREVTEWGGATGGEATEWEAVHRDALCIRFHGLGGYRLGDVGLG